MKLTKSILNEELVNGPDGIITEKIIFDIIFRHMKDLVFVMKVEEGPSFRYVFANESAQEHAKITADSLGRTLEDVLPFELAFPLQKEYEKLLKRGTVHVFLNESPFGNGEKVVGETILTPVKDLSGEIRYVIAVTREVTEKLVEQLRLIESEQRYKSIVENNIDAIFSIDFKGKILDANPAAALVTGYTQKQLMNRSLYNLIDDYGLRDLQNLLERTQNGFAMESLDCRFIHQNGHLLTVHIKTVPIAIHGDISGIYVIMRDISMEARHAETIRYMAFHDQLTGLYNRRALLDHLNDSIHTFSNKRIGFALISIDLDRFKHLNDTLGHLVGDEILKKVADRLSELQTDSCLVYRQGGDEFMILLLNTTRRDTTRFVQETLNMFAKSFYFNSQEYYISPSIGISMFPNDGKNAETLIKNADEALYRVKDRGKAHFQFYRSDMSNEILNVVTLETNLRKAIKRNEFTLFFQPQIDLKTSETKSFEALLRWNNEELGNIPPSIFIPLAEDTGLIVSIGNWVIEQACKQISDWNKSGYHDIRVAVNISPKQFQQPNLVPFIRTMIEKYRVLPSSLEIEITESAMQDTKETIPTLKSLKEIGLAISVDDFGTGYSSLNYLKKFPIDVLKIDQSFIRDILHDEKDAAITSTIIHLGRSLGMEVIAEGVEDKNQIDFLSKAMCHKAQGYYYAKPLPASDIERDFLNICNKKG
ncbi:MULTISPECIES: EAL domain-containing protein [unclassified Bacillus (in: firmicutes)]|uniref:sensor domain-containing protein n=1 Tax=unclassified Bacillus (in: firmicutes) TaxID=185979 RepID=UPI0008EAB11F|nr:MULTISPECIES: EAL domain-containing protein [unclassified Bacillus (in: firmicutes)]SFA76804.1 PAS domain S-box-containing protein/diguanylate cyclase (GGDEF) domain-containing protein [Bacillus sp. UNCCL13]SFQ66681.1 PAS domain S-box-containing protein/diguanylate cyclase (GGDEF) domain-containing protein [Bacillus sp. cl95]